METVEQYGQNFRTFWDTVEAFGGSPGVHKGMIDPLLKDASRVANVGSPTPDEMKKVKEDAIESVKTALLISGADRNRYWKLKDELANNYLLGTDQYPDMFDKAMRILRNYQVIRSSRPFRGDGNESGLAFLQRGGSGRGRGGRGLGAGQGLPTGTDAGGGRGDASTTTGGSGDNASHQAPQGQTDREIHIATTVEEWIIGHTSVQT